MQFLSNYINPILELLTLSIQLILFMLPSEPPVIIHSDSTYYFQNTTDNKVPSNRSTPAIVIVSLIGSYLLYSIVNNYIIVIVMIIALITMLRYKYLGIGYKKEFILPTLFSIMFYSLNFLPSDVKNFWLNNAKLDLSQFTGIQRIINNLKQPINDFLDLFIHFHDNIDRNISIIGTIILVFFVLFFQSLALFQKKEYIKITKIKDITPELIASFTAYSFVFYSVEWNPTRKIIEAIIYFLNH